MSIRFEEINESNCEECARLKVMNGQEKYLRSNGAALVYWKFYPHWSALAIYEEDNMVGFLMYGVDYMDDTMNIISFMIDERYQGRGYGKAAVEKLIDRMKEEAAGRQIWVGVHPRNVEAQKLYSKFGFKRSDTYTSEHDEIFFVLENGEISA
ncbi:MAG: GNAT family N-acetyltransferase [Bacillota bacterium]|nr:GNAT family N-acetyltransferase [Bacillota bacterium]